MEARGPWAGFPHRGRSGREGAGLFYGRMTDWAMVVGCWVFTARCDNDVEGGVRKLVVVVFSKLRAYRIQREFLNVSFS